MRFNVTTCPECNGEIIGMVEQVQVLTHLELTIDGYEYTGETSTWWETQEPLWLVQCANKHEWKVEEID